MSCSRIEQKQVSENFVISLQHTVYRVYVSLFQLIKWNEMQLFGLMNHQLQKAIFMYLGFIDLSSDKVAALHFFVYFFLPKFKVLLFLDCCLSSLLDSPFFCCLCLNLFNKVDLTDSIYYFGWWYLMLIFDFKFIPKNFGQFFTGKLWVMKFDVIINLDQLLLDYLHWLDVLARHL